MKSSSTLADEAAGTLFESSSRSTADGMFPSTQYWPPELMAVPVYVSEIHAPIVRASATMSEDMSADAGSARPPEVVYPPVASKGVETMPRGDSVVLTGRVAGETALQPKTLHAVPTPVLIPGDA